MASLSELVGLAQHLQKAREPLGKQILDHVPSYVGALNQRKANQAQAQRDQLDAYVKILDINEKMESIRLKQQQQQMMDSVSKSLGFTPLTESENANAREVANGQIGAGQKFDAPATKQGKLMKLVDDMEIGSISMTSGGPSIYFRRKGDKGYGSGGVKDEISRNEKIRKIATDMAQREYDQTNRASGGKDALGRPITNFGRVPDHLVQKYLGTAEAFLTGDNEEYRKRLKEMMDQNDPFGFFGGADLSGIE